MNTPGQRRQTKQSYCLTALCAGLSLISAQAVASSHREAPFLSMQPSVDGTDFYMFRSYETGRQGYVTVLPSSTVKRLSH